MRIVLIVLLVWWMKPCFGSDSRFLVEQNGKRGYIDETGTLVIEASYVAAYDFVDGRAWVMPSQEVSEVIDSHGKIAANCQKNYKLITQFCEGYAVVMDEGAWGYLDQKAEIAVPLRFDKATDFSEGLAGVFVKTNGTVQGGWIGKDGNFVIPPRFDLVGPFKEGLAQCAVGNLEGFIDVQGRVVIDMKYSIATSFSDGLALVYDGHHRAKFIDKAGKIIVEFSESSSASPFHEGVAAVKLDGVPGFIDKTGKMIIKGDFDKVASFSEGLAAVCKNGKWGCIDQSGKLIFGYQFPEKFSFKNGLALVRTPEGKGYINRSGVWVWKPSK